MDEQITALVREVQELRERQLQVRDDAIFRRMTFHEERMDVFAEALKKTITAVADCADIITKVSQRIDALVVRIDTMVVRIDIMVVHMDIMVVRMDEMVARMDKTDERWNQLSTN